MRFYIENNTLFCNFNRIRYGIVYAEKRVVLQCAGNPAVAFLLKLERELFAAAFHNSSVEKNVHRVRLQEVQDALVVCNYK